MHPLTTVLGVTVAPLVVLLVLGETGGTPGPSSSRNTPTTSHQSRVLSLVTFELNYYQWSYLLLFLFSVCIPFSACLLNRVIFLLGTIQKLRNPLRGRGGGQQKIT